MKWSYSFNANDKRDARAKIQAESANCPVTDLVHRAVEALPADRPLSVVCYGEMSDAETPRMEQDRPALPAMGTINITVRLLEQVYPPAGEPTRLTADGAR